MNAKVIHSKNISSAAAKDKLMEDLHLVVADAEELLHATASQAGEGAAVVRTRIQKNLRDVKNRLVEAEDVVIERARQAAQVTDQYVHDNPWQSIGISACAGMVIGMLIARR